ncbi:MAG: hypothetical protein PHE77_00340 [Candidatus Pacebacteria bacterium]|nr:hypothetical protein [Candidatus Paceibacterota bacterium]
MQNDIIKIEIKCSSYECEQARESGQFFEAIAATLCIEREDIKEVIDTKRSK